MLCHTSQPHLDRLCLSHGAETLPMWDVSSTFSLRTWLTWHFLCSLQLWALDIRQELMVSRLISTHFCHRWCHICVLFSNLISHIMYIADELNTPGIWSYFYDFRIIKLSGGRDSWEENRLEGKLEHPAGEAPRVEDALRRQMPLFFFFLFFCVSSRDHSCSPISCDSSLTTPPGYVLMWQNLCVCDWTLWQPNK